MNEPTIDPLPWDSDFFGMSIGRAHLTGADEGALSEIDRKAREAGIACLYASLDPNDLELNFLAQRQGYRLVEVSIDLEHPTSVLQERPSTRSVAREGTPDDVEVLAEEIRLLARWSRFAADRRFGPGAAERMHRAWVERAASGVGNRMLVVAEDEDGLTGFSTQTDPAADVPRIDLIASSQPGSGAAQELVAFSYERFGKRPSRGGPIAARNTASIRFVEQMGLRIVSTRYLYHRWLDEAGWNER